MKNSAFNEEASKEEFIFKSKNEFWIKRDDLIHPIASGNKWRKLKYVLDYYVQNDFRQLVSFGGAYSNHIIATACACAKFKIMCVLIIRGEEPKEPNHYLLFCKSFGAKLIFVSREKYKNKEELCLELGYSTKPDTFILPEGGEHELANLGCQEIIKSLTQEYDFIYTASGTGTTSLGLAKEIANQGLKTKLMVVPVLKNEEEIRKKLHGYKFVEVLENGHLGGYAKTNSAVFNQIDEALLDYGITLDPVYTGKSFLKMINHSQSYNDKKVLFLHTGGTFGLLSSSMLKKWNSAQVGS